MSHGHSHSPTKPWGIAPTGGVILGLLVFAMTQVVIVLAGLPPIFDGALWDADSYMWLNRVRHLHETGTWLDPFNPRINPPEGFVQHWTRPLDAILLAGAWILALALGFETALYWWSVALSPILLVISLPTLAWAARPLLPPSLVWLPGLVLVCRPGVIAHFMAGRPDHHSLLLLLFIVLIGLLLRQMQQPERHGLAILSGLVGACALWISVQALPIIAAIVAAMGLFWLGGDRVQLRNLVIHAAVLLLGLLAALLIERGTGRFSVSEFDTLSIVHVLIFALNLGVWLGAFALWDQKGAARSGGLFGRAGYLAAAGCAAVALLWWLQPELFQNPLMKVDELYGTAHLTRIRELQPVLPLFSPNFWTWEQAVARPILMLGAAVPTVPWLLYLVARRRGPERRAWIALGLLCVVWLPFGLYQVRWLSFAEVSLVIPYAALGGAVLAWLDRQHLPEMLLRLGRPVVLASWALWFVVPMAFVADKAGNAPVKLLASRSVCPVKPLAQFLSDPEALGAEPRRLLAFVDFGPELLYRTPHSVYSIPNHRYQAGFSLSHRILTATDVAVSRDSLQAAGIDLVAICPGSTEREVYGLEGDGSSLYELLSRGTPPDFLAPVSLPPGLEQTFKVYRVRIEQ